MKAFLVGLVLCLSLSLLDFARATGPEYFSSRDSIKEKAPSKSSSREVVYLGTIASSTGFEAGFQVPYQKTLTIENLVAMTSYKASVAAVIVLRAAKRVDPVFDDVVKPESKVNFTLQPGDVVWGC